MTDQEKKEALGAYRAAVREGERLGEEIQLWRARAERMTASVRLAPAGRSGRRSLEEAVEEIDGLMRRLGAQQRALVRERLGLERAVEAVGDRRLQELLRLRYVEGMSFEAIAERMGYSVRQTLRLHAAALEQVQPGCH